ncbi:MAG: peptidylprolyl isomerase [Planctomycetaceae bacterium]
MVRAQSLVIALIVTGLSLALAQAQPRRRSSPLEQASFEGPASGALLAVVNGQKITEGDLERSFQMRQVPAGARDEVRDRFIQELVDGRLISQFLAQRKIAADKREVAEQVARIKELARNRGSDPERVMADLGYSEESLREEFALPLAWKRYIEKTVTAERLKGYFQEHQPEFDGTRVRARHILIKVAGNDEHEWRAAEKELERLRRQIAARENSFEEAAREFSQAPSGEEGGDVGWFPWVGKMPVAFSKHAFAMRVGELSQPFRTKFGVHLCLVTDRKAGTIELEDVRDEVLAKLSQDLWKQTAADLRKSAKIEWKIKSP